MNIAFDAKRITHNATGLGNYSRFVLDTLTEFRPENRYLLFSPSTGDPSLYKRLLSNRSVRLITPHRALAFAGGNLWRNFSVASRCRTEQVDLFHGLTNELPIGLYNAQRIGTVVTMHDLAFIRYPQFYKPIDRLLYRKKYGASARHADHVITVSDQTRRDVIDIFGIEEERVTTVYQGCSEAFAAVTPEDVVVARQALNLPERYILFVGSIEERKNLALIVEALAQLQDKDVHLVAVGQRPPSGRPLSPAHQAWRRLGDAPRYLCRSEGLRLPLALRGLWYPSHRSTECWCARHRCYGLLSGGSWWPQQPLHRPQ